LKLHSPAIFLPLLVAAAIGFSYWAVSIEQQMTAEREFSRLLREEPRAVVEARESGLDIPRRGRSHSYFADLLTTELFPPPYDQAVSEVGKALLYRPLDSKIWVQAARFLLFLGEDQRARAALNVSDQIDPRFPIQRIEAIRLWGLLDDSDRAMEIAQNVARLGSPFREQAAGELAGIGIDPPRIFSLVSYEGITSEGLFLLTQAIIDADPARVEETILELPKEVVREDEFRRQLAVLLEKTRRFTILLSLWAMEGAELEESLPGLFAANADLSLPARADLFPLGWQSPKDIGDLEVRWIAPNPSGSDSSGMMEINIGSESGRQIKWTPYRTIIPPNVPVRITLNVRQEPFFGGVLTMRGRTPHNLVHGPSTDPRQSGWVDLSLVVPAQPTPEVLSVELEWERRGEGTGETRQFIFIGSIAFADPADGTLP
jgi:hypothetical protein